MTWWSNVNTGQSQCWNHEHISNVNNKQSIQSITEQLTMSIIMSRVPAPNIFHLNHREITGCPSAYSGLTWSMSWATPRVHSAHYHYSISMWFLCTDSNARTNINRTRSDTQRTNIRTNNHRTKQTSQPAWPLHLVNVGPTASICPIRLLRARPQAPRSVVTICRSVHSSLRPLPMRQP